MIIKSIELENFRQYKGKKNINFSTDGEKNVTVIIGQNTGGKTTLVRSFIWCLYGDKGFKDKSLINAEVAEELKRSGIVGKRLPVSVSIKLVHNDITYIISRHELYTLTNGDKFNVSEDFSVYKEGMFGSLVKITDKKPVDVVNEILPKELSDYFFFWGEKIETLSDKTSIDAAVKNFLGLNTIVNTRKHLSKAIKDFNDIIVSQSSDSEVEKLKRTQETFEGYVRTNNIRINEYQADKDYWEKEYEEAQQDFYKLKGKKEQQGKLDDLTSRKSRYERDLAKAKEDIIKKFNNNTVNYFAQPLVEEAITVLKNNPDESTGWTHINVKAIEEIIKKGECICGQKITSESEAYRHLVGQKSIVAPNVIGALSNAFITKAKSQRRYYESYKDDLTKAYSNIDELSYDISVLADQIREIQLTDNDVVELQNKENRVKNSKQKRDRAIANLAKERQALNDNLNKIDGYKKRIEQLIKKQHANDMNYKYWLYAKAVLADINGDYQSKEKEIKEKLQKYSQDYFNEMYTGERIIKITDNFNIETYNMVNGRALKSETSPGLETVKNFAFISALVQIAKERIKIEGLSDGDEDIISSEPYPLVLDAPFSQADEKHVPAISKKIADTAEQIILVVMEKDWNFAKGALAEKVGKYYELEKLSETETIVTSKEGI